MNIYLIRHSDAEKASLKIKDFDRELSTKGKSKIKIAVENWKNIIPAFDYIVTSPLKRAAQTAKIIASGFNYEDEIIIDKRMGTGSKTEDLIDIANYLGSENIAFIGHQPDLAIHTSNLISSSGAFLDFKPASIVKISFNNKIRTTKGYLEFLIPPQAYK